MSVDLRDCRPGQKVRTSSGEILTFRDVAYIPQLELYYFTTKSGTLLEPFTYKGKHPFNSNYDVVEILPLTFNPEAVTPQITPTFCADIAASPSTPEAEELIRVYDATFGSTAPGCCPAALAAVLLRIAESDPSSRDLHRLAAALRGG